MHLPRLIAAAALLAGVGVLAGCGGTAAPTSGASATVPTAVTTTPSTAHAAVTAASVAATPVQIATTSLGAVGYRSIGAGPTVLLIMGFSGSMTTWTPQFVAGLAQTHRVILFDNAGIGETAALPSPLTITAMAKQTAALLTTLSTGPVDVLGWSMGGMIAQALAVQQPTLVSHLALAATLPGDGTAVNASAAATRQLAASVTNPAAILPLLFPTTASAASSAFVTESFSWKAPETVPAAVDAAQGGALVSWVGGQEPVGHRIDTITVPTLVADGSEDQLAPKGNVAALATAIHGAQTVLYPGAAHAFLFQDQDQYLAKVETLFGR